MKNILVMGLALIGVIGAIGIYVWALFISFILAALSIISVVALFVWSLISPVFLFAFELIKSLVFILGNTYSSIDEMIASTIANNNKTTCINLEFYKAQEALEELPNVNLRQFSSKSCFNFFDIDKHIRYTILMKDLVPGISLSIVESTSTQFSSFNEMWSNALSKNNTIVCTQMNKTTLKQFNLLNEGSNVARFLYQSARVSPNELELSDTEYSDTDNCEVLYGSYKGHFISIYDNDSSFELHVRKNDLENSKEDNPFTEITLNKKNNPDNEFDDLIRFKKPKTSEINDTPEINIESLINEKYIDIYESVSTIIKTFEDEEIVIKDSVSSFRYEIFVSRKGERYNLSENDIPHYKLNQDYIVNDLTQLENILFKFPIRIWQSAEIGYKYSIFDEKLVIFLFDNLKTNPTKKNLINTEISSPSLTEPLELCNLVDVGIDESESKDVFLNLNNNLHKFRDDFDFDNTSDLIQMAYAYCIRFCAAGFYLQGVWGNEEFDNITAIFIAFQKITSGSVKFQNEAFDESLKLIQLYDKRLNQHAVKLIVTAVNAKTVCCAKELGVAYDYEQVLNALDLAADE